MASSVAMGSTPVQGSFQWPALMKLTGRVQTGHCDIGEAVLYYLVGTALRACQCKNGLAMLWTKLIWLCFHACPPFESEEWMDAHGFTPQRKR